MFSQNDEETYILDHFNGKPPGRLLDVGTYDGRTFSNTLALFNMGWSGLCLEPDPIVFPALRTLHRENPRVKLLESALSKEDGVVDFFSSRGDAVSTTSTAHKELWERNAGVIFNPITVKAISYKTLAERFGGKFDFLNLDVEGTNVELLKTLPLDEMGVELVCIECEDQAMEVVRYCAGLGLDKLVHRTRENLIIARPNESLPQ